MNRKTLSSTHVWQWPGQHWTREAEIQRCIPSTRTIVQATTHSGAIIIHSGALERLFSVTQNKQLWLVPPLMRGGTTCLIAFCSLDNLSREASCVCCPWVNASVVYQSTITCVCTVHTTASLVSNDICPRTGGNQLSNLSQWPERRYAHVQSTTGQCLWWFRIW